MSSAPSAVIRRALARLGADGRFHPDDVPGVRAVAAEIGAGEPIDDPEDLFGPWVDLPTGAQDALRALIEADISRRMDLYPHGSFWTGLVRGARILDRFLVDHGDPFRLRGAVVGLAGHLHGGPRNVWQRACRARHRRDWKYGSRPSLAAMLTALERDPHWLVGGFARGVRSDPRARSLYHDPSANVVFGHQIGIDLIDTPEGLFCTEANLQPGLDSPIAAELIGDVMVDGIVGAAVDQGARRILWMEADRLPLARWTLTKLHESVRRAGLSLDVFEDPCMPPHVDAPPEGQRSRRWPHRVRPPHNSLVVRRNSFEVGADFAISNKEPFIRGVGRILAAEARVRTLPMTRHPGDVALPSDPGLPNLVYKYADSFHAQGVFFMRARDAEHALAMARELDRQHGEPPGLFQPFKPPRFLEDRRVFDLRALILVTPIETRYLGAVRNEQSNVIPERASEGILERKLFVPKGNLGSSGQPLDPELEGRCRDATIAIGDAIRQLVHEGFVDRPPGR